MCLGQPGAICDYHRGLGVKPQLPLFDPLDREFTRAQLHILADLWEVIGARFNVADGARDWREFELPDKAATLALLDRDIRRELQRLADGDDDRPVVAPRAAAEIRVAS